MSIGECRGWLGFVERLTEYAGIPNKPTKGDEIRLASAALTSLRRQGKDIGDAVRKSVYADVPHQLTHNRVLAQLFWPLVCTTNYDDVYISEVDRRKGKPTVRGRSESDCRRILQHLSFPAGEIVWALQGFLAPRTSQLTDCLGEGRLPTALESELVVGPVEYRKAAHLSPHFRRSFSEVFRQRSLLFLGAGLSEPYILNLFDEIIALAGPPSKPHFALVQEGSVDVDLMREHYHVVCNTYPEKAHHEVSDLLQRLALHVDSARSRPHAWGYRVSTPARVESEHEAPHFEVIRAQLPHTHRLQADEVVAISCGRERGLDPRGEPKPGHLLEGRVVKERETCVLWHNDWTITWADDPRLYGVVAREKHLVADSSSRDVRSPEAIRKAFKAFLHEAASRGARRAHVQLLAAGRHHVFSPWIALVQMARAYGQWVMDDARRTALRVSVYVVAPDVVALLDGGYLNLTEHLQDGSMRINVEVVDAFGSVQSHQEIVGPAERLETLRVFSTGPTQPWIHAIPSPRLNALPTPLDALMRTKELRDFGLVSGSTLVVDYRARI